jgi:hypothetical protein
MIIYIRTIKTASSTVNNWLGSDLYATFNVEYLDSSVNQKQLNRAIENNFYFFTTVRNPFTRAVSQWRQAVRSGFVPKEISLIEYINHKFPKDDWSSNILQSSITEYIQPVFDKIKLFIKTEEVKPSLRSLEKQFNLGKRKIRYYWRNRELDGFNYQEFYTKENIKAVVDRYADDFDNFGYSKKIEDL